MSRHSQPQPEKPQLEIEKARYGAPFCIKERRKIRDPVTSEN
jgi:hypothetical protein